MFLRSVFLEIGHLAGFPIDVENIFRTVFNIFIFLFFSRNRFLKGGYISNKKGGWCTVIFQGVRRGVCFFVRWGRVSVFMGGFQKKIHGMERARPFMPPNLRKSILACMLKLLYQHAKSPVYVCNCFVNLHLLLVKLMQQK